MFCSIFLLGHNTGILGTELKAIRCKKNTIPSLIFYFGIKILKLFFIIYLTIW